MPERFIIGAMSGTSADGVDAALVAITGDGHAMTARFIAHRHTPFADSLRARVWTIRQKGSVTLAELAAVGREISLYYASAVSAVLDTAGTKASEVQAIAAHGQTLFHAPPLTIQWFDPAVLAFESGCRVISDFRRADCAAGGQGAPLVPFADELLFRDSKIDRAVVNIGGIANLTLLPAGQRLRSAFDCGPGNCISDHLMRTAEPDGLGVDLNGDRASSGKPSRAVSERFASDRYFATTGPKSTDGPAMIAIYRTARAGEQLKIEDELATACWITAECIAAAVRSFGDPFAGEIIISGGGTKNCAIMKYLRELLPSAIFRSTEEFGIPGDAKEAVAFALLGAATLDGIPANIPAATGASRAVVLGAITPKP
jgi:anhydro-N-acetylmuramic acid kinase